MNKHIQTRTSKTAFALLPLLLASACSTPEGYFGFEATDAQGKPIKTGMVTIADCRWAKHLHRALEFLFRTSRRHVGDSQCEDERRTQASESASLQMNHFKVQHLKNLNKHQKGIQHERLG